MSASIGITGATGYVGRALSEHLYRAGHAPIEFSRQREALKATGRSRPWREDPEAFAGLETIVHLLGDSDPRAEETVLLAANRDMAIRTFTSAARAGVRRFIYLSSMAVHGRTAPDPVTPRTPPAPVNAYGRSKLAGERALAPLAEEAGVELVIVRAPMIYGPGAKGSFAQLASLVRRGLPLPFGRATAPRSFCSVANLVDALTNVIERDRPRSLLLPADPSDCSTRTLIEHMQRAVGRATPLLSVPPAMIEWALARLGRKELAQSLLDPLCIDRAHWADWAWTPPQSVADGVAAAMARTDR